MRVAMLLHKSVRHDSRVRREARALAQAGHEVVVLELAPVEAGDLDGFARRSVLPPPWARRLPYHANRALCLLSFVRAVTRVRPDVVHAHDAAMLLPGLAGARLTGARLVYDSHELATGVPYRERFWSWFVAAVEQVGVPRADAVITVSNGIADRLSERYRLRERPAVVRNVCDLPAPDPSVAPGALRHLAGVPDGEPLILHQGAAALDRGCETLVRAVARLDRGHLVFLGDGDPGLAERLSEIAHAEGVADRVHLVGSVAPERLLTYTRDADVGVSLLQDTCENHRLALPNKVFEYVAAGVPVVVSDLPEVGGLVRRSGIGWQVRPHSPESIANGLGLALNGGGDAVRARLWSAADELSWERERGRLTEIYERLRPGTAITATGVALPATADAQAPLGPVG
jgi:glycosyltransferase involved in cell wall biosynthesis